MFAGGALPAGHMVQLQSLARQTPGLGVNWFAHVWSQMSREAHFYLHSICIQQRPSPLSLLGEAAHCAASRLASNMWPAVNCCSVHAPAAGCCTTCTGPHRLATMRSPDARRAPEAWEGLRPAALVHAAGVPCPTRGRFVVVA